MNIKPSNMTETKWRLFKVAIDLFAQKGYKHVSVREIAEVMQCWQGSIYNHISSKEDFLTEAFDFYMAHYTAILPPLPDFVGLLDTLKPDEIWDKVYPLEFDEPELAEIMPKILLIALTERFTFPAAKALCDTVFFDIQRKYLSALLREMHQRGMIEPVDVDILSGILASVDIWASLNAGGNLEVPLRDWHRSHKLIFSLLKYKTPND